MISKLKNLDVSVRNLKVTQTAYKKTQAKNDIMQNNTSS